ncbi:MAG: D-alanine--D-alanine ligase [Bacteroides sp.]|nr:D-alanine--D-alanine ligase [Ruminococcus flavefaciens]MCM1555344.1 D-alanine--D-alanine ligase [Bacteroides sp.]
MKTKKNIALVCGGYSKESVISVMGAESIEKHIPTDRYRVFKIVIEPNRWYYKSPDGGTEEVDRNNFTLAGNIHFDLAYINIHGTPGENGLLQSYFDMLHIPYTTCNACTSALTFHKFFCNSVLAHHGVRVADSVRLFRHEKYDVEEIGKRLGFPCFVKPNAEGSSIGVSKVKQVDDLQEAIEKAFGEDKEVMVEKFIDGKEYSCGLMRLKGELLVFPLAAIVPKKDFFDYEAKYQGASDEIVPAPIAPELAAEIGEIAKKVYHLLNCSGVVRCDFIVEESTQKPYFLEVNTTPGQSEESIVPKQVRQMGWSLEEFYTNVIEEALNR